jgi:uncharacterized membrane protein
MYAHWTFGVIEFVTYGFFLLMCWHVWVEGNKVKLVDTNPADGQLPTDDLLNRERWLFTLIWGVGFGLIIEWVLIYSNVDKASYKYGHFLVMVPNPLPKGGPVPFWIAVGWGVILYATTWTAQRLRLPRFTRAVFAGLLAVNIDLSLDPVAEALHFWTWQPQFASYYDVPFDNFICWFVVVSTYGLLVRWLFQRKLAKKLWSAFWIPMIAASVASGVVYIVDSGLDIVYHWIGGDAPVFALVFIAACVFVAHYARRPERDLVPSSHVIALPVAMHLLCFGMLLSWLVIETHPESMQPAKTLGTLLVGIPLALAVGYLAFQWASLDCLFPRTQTATVPSPAAPSKPSSYPPASMVPSSSAEASVLAAARPGIDNAQV